CDTAEDIARAKEILERTGADDVSSAGEEAVAVANHRHGKRLQGGARGWGGALEAAPSFRRPPRASLLRPAPAGMPRRIPGPAPIRRVVATRPTSAARIRRGPAESRRAVLARARRP